MAGDTFALVVQGIDIGGSIQDVDPKIVRAAYQAINAAAARGRTLAAREIAKQVAFPSDYLSPSGGRLYVGSKASGDSLRTTITARDRSTSLARFTSGSIPTKGRQAGVIVTVKPGAARYLPGAFLIRLKSGNDDTLNNLGLAIRTSGGPPSSAYKPKQIGPNLYLLYGPSVGAAFKGEDGRGVRDTISEAVNGFLVEEFDRLMELNNG